MSKIIDLTFPVKEHWRWLVKMYPHPTFNNRVRHMFVDYNLHSFTHVDSLLHFIPGTPGIDKVPMDKFMGEAAVVNLSHLGADDAVTAADLEKHGQHVRAGDIVLLRTDWPLKCDVGTRDFWGKAPYTAADACEWLVDRKVKTVGYDYPPDYVNKYEVIEPDHKFRYEEYTTHIIFFPKEIFVVEYLCNLHLITKNRVQFIALPIPFVGSEGAPVRAIAIED